MENKRNGKWGRMAMTAGILGGILALANAACGTSTSPNDANSAATCKVTLSGAVTGTHGCVVAMGLNSTTDTVDMGVSAAISQTEQFSLALKFPGTALTAGTFTSSTDGAAGAVVESQIPKVWDAVRGDPPDQGTFSITISGTGTPVTGNTGDVGYLNTHGSADATMPAIASSGATGTVTVHVTW